MDTSETHRLPVLVGPMLVALVAPVIVLIVGLQAIVRDSVGDHGQSYVIYGWIMTLIAAPIIADQIRRIMRSKGEMIVIAPTGISDPRNFGSEIRWQDIKSVELQRLRHLFASKPVFVYLPLERGAHIDFTNGGLLQGKSKAIIRPNGKEWGCDRLFATVTAYHQAHHA